MTAEKNGAVAAGVLEHAADAFAEPPSNSSAMPNAVWEDLWVIANAPTELAAQRWESLGRVSDGADDAERAWRDALISSEQFMALASDLSRNFLVLVPLESCPNERRILKMAYEEAQPRPDSFEWPRVYAAREAARGVTARVKRWYRKSPESPKGVGLLKIQATVRRTTEQGTLRQQDAGYADALPGLTVVVRGPDGLKWADEIETDAKGCGYKLLAAGEYAIEERVPAGLLEESEPKPVSVRPGVPAKVRLEHRQIGTLAMRHTFDAPRPKEPTRRRLLRFLGGEAQRLVFLVPAVGQAKTYHVEFEAPEGLAVTRGRLDARPSYWSIDEGENPSVARDIEPETTRRSHLYLPDISQGCSGRAIFSLRPRPSTIIRAAVMASIVITILLGLVVARLDAVRGNVGPTITLLLLLPGVLSAYVVRPREHPFTTRTALGVRLLAVGPALCAFVMALVIDLHREWEPTTSGYKPLDSWDATGLLCGALTGISGLFCLALALTWRVAARPPEQKR
jgi:hypothetical protein